MTIREFQSKISFKESNNYFTYGSPYPYASWSCPVFHFLNYPIQNYSFKKLDFSQMDSCTTSKLTLTILPLIIKVSIKVVDGWFETVLVA